MRPLMMILCVFDFAWMRRVLALLCLFLTHTRQDLNLVCTQESESGDARFGIGWRTAVADATDEAIR